MAIELDEVRELILTKLPGAEVEVSDDTGQGDHLSVVVRAPQFAGLGRVEQHRIVKAAVQERMDDGSIHALSVKTEAMDAEGASGGGDAHTGAEGSEAVTSEIDAQSPPEED
ncbi:MAG TPA: BolA/IbaG family iron-sulfur metabolism protein [Solirubrobacterales bacterium]|nr:BolA/IbaG family iron-sulfur metabolism protein [Solirubrobacterales bacterium]